MKRDWMATGRRPTGICGAALLLAARAYNVNRAVSDIVKIVHISETVVRKRLDEFANTASGNLTIDEFNVVDLVGQIWIDMDLVLFLGRLCRSSSVSGI
jgi:transcription factor IIIB subunit 2